jgi:hypothetical protein
MLTAAPTAQPGAPPRRVLGVVGAAVYRGHMAEVVPAGVPDQAAVALDTLGGAVAVSGQLPERLGAAAPPVTKAVCRSTTIKAPAGGGRAVMPRSCPNLPRRSAGSWWHDGERGVGKNAVMGRNRQEEVLAEL